MARTRIDSFDRELKLRLGDAVSAVRSEFEERMVVLEADVRARNRWIEDLQAEVDRERQKARARNDCLRLE